MVLLIALCLLLVVIDTYVSYKRIKAYGRFAELNLLVRQSITDFGLPVGLSIGVLYNLGLVGLLAYLHARGLLIFLAGVKFGLVLMQLKSMQMETFVEKVLSKARTRKQDSSPV